MATTGCGRPVDGATTYTAVSATAATATTGASTDVEADDTPAAPPVEYSLLIPVIVPSSYNNVQSSCHNIHSLLDTGSSVSLIEKQFVTNDLQLSDTVVMKTVGSGQGLISTHKVTQHFVLNGKLYLHDFFVVETLNLPGVSMIMGYDLITKLKLIINAGKSSVTLDDLELPIFTNCQPLRVNVIRVEELKPFRLCVEDDVCLPANATLNVCLDVKSNNPNEGQLLLLEIEPKFLDCCPTGMLVKVDADNKTYITMINLSKSSQFIQQGTTVAVAEPVIIPTMPVVSPISSMTSDACDDEIVNLVTSNTDAPYVPGVLDIVRYYRSQFVINDEPTGFTDIMPFEIATSGASPIAQRPYRIPVAYEQEVNNQLENMKRDGIISLSRSPWASPMVVVRKKDNTLRLCVDYRRLNSITEGDSFPLPSIEELLLKVRNAKFFSTLDLKSGYHQISVAPEDRPKTAFVVNNKLFEYNTLPFGLRNAPSHFSRLMTSILSGILNTAVLVYLDDLIILGETLEEHTANLIKVLEVLKKHNLKCNLAKCHFYKSEVEFLGHSISASGIRPLHDKIEAMRNFPRPKNNKEVSSFLVCVATIESLLRILQILVAHWIDPGK